MRHILLAISYFIAATQLSAEAARPESQYVFVLDLTKTPQSARSSLGVPGEHVGGVTGKIQTNAHYQLPIDITIVNLHIDGPVVKVELEIRNHGHATFGLPSCSNELKAHLGSKDRRTLQFSFNFMADEHRTSEVADVTYSGAPGCAVNLQEGAKALVILSVNVPPEFRELLSTMQIQAVCTEMSLENQRLEISAFSDPIKSSPVSLQ
ncbi:MAG: hypothetical protein JO356_03575 [Acidobacteria bacterium]|nr:hypothetical protein [Acidobacteriota bacterium]